MVKLDRVLAAASCAAPSRFRDLTQAAGLRFGPETVPAWLETAPERVHFTIKPLAFSAKSSPGPVA